MTTSAEKPTVREVVAAAISDGDLDRAATLGSAQLPRNEDGSVLTRLDDQALPLKERVQLVQRDGKDLGLELAALLLRAKYASDHRGVPRAGLLFAIRLRFRARRQIRSSSRKETLSIRIAQQSIAEWLADRCEKCSGTGVRQARYAHMQELLLPCKTCVGPDGNPTGGVYADARVRALLWSGDHDGQVLLPSAITCPVCRGFRYVFDRKRTRERAAKHCASCTGTGDARPRDADRARALGIGLHSYERNWAHWFAWARFHLNGLDKTLTCNLRSEFRGVYSSPPAVDVEHVITCPAASGSSGAD